MHGRLIVIAAAPVALAGVVAVLGVLSIAPTHHQRVRPDLPLLVERTVANPVLPPSVRPSAPSGALPTSPAPAAAREASPATTGSVAAVPTPVHPPVRPATPRGAEEVIRNRLGDIPAKPALRTEPERKEAALPAMRTEPGKKEAALPLRDEEARPPTRPRQTLAPPAGPVVARPAPVQPYRGVFTEAEIGRMRLAARLTPEQQRLWPPVEALLREIGAQQVALIQAGRHPQEAFGTGVAMRMYWAARPLLATLSEDQKAEIRARARAMGFHAVASSI